MSETRPRLQGAHLTAWELAARGVPHTMFVDSAGGLLMRRGDVDIVIVGADRVAANGDVCNKIGTYDKALAAADNDVPFYAAVPSPTFDFALPSGDAIPIEARDAEEVLSVSGRDARATATAVRAGAAGHARGELRVRHHARTTRRRPRHRTRHRQRHASGNTRDCFRSAAHERVERSRHWRAGASLGGRRHGARDERARHQPGQVRQCERTVA